MLALEEALARVLEAVPPATPHSVPLNSAEGRVLVEGVTASLDLPRFDNSSVDGYAVQAADTAGADSGHPVRLRLIGRVAAGTNFPGTLGRGECVRIFTGSPLPQGADAAVMQEDTRPGRDPATEVDIFSPASPGENVRCKGEDVRAGRILVPAGETITPARLALLAAAGVDRLSAGAGPVAGILATGSELVEPGQPIGPGQIYESNRLALSRLILKAGGTPRIFPVVQDSLDATRTALAAALACCDMIVTCGGVSVGEMDFVKAAWEELGGQLGFWRVAVKPGKPFVFGKHPKALLFGLPGNPVSALVTFVLLVRPAILRWQGALDIGLPSVQAVTREPLQNPGNRRHFMRVHLDGAGGVRSAGLQASHVLNSLAAANALVDVPPQTTLNAGTPVKALLWS